MIVLFITSLVVLLYLQIYIDFFSLGTWNLKESKNAINNNFSRLKTVLKNLGILYVQKSAFYRQNFLISVKLISILNHCWRTKFGFYTRKFRFFNYLVFGISRIWNEIAVRLICYHTLQILILLRVS